MNITTMLSSNPKRDHVHGLADSRQARYAAYTSADDSPQEAALYQLAEDLCVTLCQTAAKSPEGLLAQIVWLYEILGYSSRKASGPSITSCCLC